MFEYYWVDLQEAAKKGRPLVKRISNSAAEVDPDHRVKMKNPDLAFPVDPGGTMTLCMIPGVSSTSPMEPV